jgi:hypothetical protein
MCDREFQKPVYSPSARINLERCYVYKCGQKWILEQRGLCIEKFGSKLASYTGERAVSANHKKLYFPKDATIRKPTPHKTSLPARTFLCSLNHMRKTKVRYH